MGVGAAAGVSGIAVAAKLARNSRPRSPRFERSIRSGRNPDLRRAETVDSSFHGARIFPRADLERAICERSGSAWRRVSTVAGRRLCGLALVGRRHGCASDFVLVGGDQDLPGKFEHHDDRMRRRLDLHCRMDGRSSFLHSRSRRRAAPGALCRLPLDPARLVGEHRHGRRLTSRRRCLPIG